MSEVKGVLDNFRFETFVDVHSNIFAEYLSSVIAKLLKCLMLFHKLILRLNNTDYTKKLKNKKYIKQ